ncbi:cysteine desulfurase [Afifella marina]|uniref:Cysteine desulfurase n=1 Tax=Afifella marina DSM 2698 TaxID=1120955 RepID=A0A1G5NK61_AFIMA|nr:cysteine desulfurase [Afifella marina]MBK1623716.1 cysteine desulfurase [Afifella marina DSM 2698]MBK1626709.1 cysteine desulfurase [Afifella marina]MBK5916258.1 cysteine desulfurase [Afifella marina]RAI21552.1 cysteine desulfurase [Afifella marina DSM 2698]SCZ37833.1 cysteine desulfurase [Afifella marina DSM 2698]
MLTKNATYDVEAVRADFPALALEVYGKPLVYLDNGASAQKPQAMIDAVSRAYAQTYSNVHRGLHFLSNAATEAYEDARETVRGFLNAASVDEVIFTRSSTEAINLVAASYGSMAIGEGDEIVLSILEHHSNIVPWNYHRERAGAVIRWAPIREDDSFDLEAFERLLNDRTKMVAVTHLSNVTGTVVPIREICRLAHERGIPVLVDGSQAAVHLPIDVQDLGCDFYVFTGHKTYGPTGIGVLWAKREWLEKMPPFLGGGEMIKDVTQDGVTYAEPPHKFEAGTPPIVQAIGLGSSLKYMKELGREKIAAHEHELKEYAHERLGEINSLTIYGHAPDKSAIISFNLEGTHPHDVSMIIDREGVAVRAGTHCAQPLLTHYGTTATCRASFGLYNTKAEVDKLAEALMKAQTFFA